jgi:hypothetical protein
LVAYATVLLGVLNVIRDAIVQSELEWDPEEPSAIVFAIVCGWHEALPEVAEKFGWSEEQISRLSRLQANFVRFCPEAGDD